MPKKGHARKEVTWKAKLLRNRKSRIERLRAIVLEAKDKPCTDCGIRYPFYVMQFDHLPGTIKKLNLNQAHRSSYAVIMAEIAKCEVVCANCHHIRSYNRLRS